MGGRRRLAMVGLVPSDALLGLFPRTSRGPLACLGPLWLFRKEEKGATSSNSLARHARYLWRASHDGTGETCHFDDTCVCRNALCLACQHHTWCSSYCVDDYDSWSTAVLKLVKYMESNGGVFDSLPMSSACFESRCVLKCAGDGVRNSRPARTPKEGTGRAYQNH